MANIDLNLIKVFYIVAKENSITKASEILFISQPAVSQSIKKLEQEMGGTLFYRSNKGIKLTEEGKIFFEYAKTSIEVIEKGYDEFLNYKNLQSGRVNIGISTILTKIVLTEVLKQFCSDYPNIKVNIINEASPKLLNGLNSMLYDFIVINDSEDLKNCDGIKLKDLSLCFVYNPDFYAYDSIKLNQIGKLPLIIQNKLSHTRKLFDKFIQEHNISVEPKYEVGSQELVKFMALQGFGVGLVFDADIPKELKKINTDISLPQNKIILIENAENTYSFASKMFKEYLIKHFLDIDNLSNMS